MSLQLYITLARAIPVHFTICDHLIRPGMPLASGRYRPRTLSSQVWIDPQPQRLLPSICWNFIFVISTPFKTLALIGHLAWPKSYHCRMPSGSCASFSLLRVGQLLSTGTPHTVQNPLPKMR